MTMPALSAVVDAETLRVAMLAAQSLRMRFQQSRDNPALASITCMECGWPSPPPMGFVIAKYAEGPFGCALCPPAPKAKP